MRGLAGYSFAALVAFVPALGRTALAGQDRPLGGPPPGFERLFNGTDLSGWKGLVGNPVTRAKMSPEELEGAQKRADEAMRAHWKVADGTLVFDGHGSHLCTEKDYKDFELLVDWKIAPGGDSGVYLRGSPQVQIWDPARWPEGSGGLYNNQKHPRRPLARADRPIGEWNTFRIRMVGERVTVHLNGTLVVDDVVMENYWERGRPIYAAGQIELQSHGSRLHFKNVFVREIPRSFATDPPDLAAGWRRLFNGRNLAGWTGAVGGYLVEEGVLVCPVRGGGNLYTLEEFGDFVLHFEFRLTPGANNGLAVRAPLRGDAAYEGMEIQILDDSDARHARLKPYQYHGSIYGVVPAERGFLAPVGEWNVQEVAAEGRRVTVRLNGAKIVDADIDEASAPGTMDGRAHPGLGRETGHVGFLGHGSRVEFREIWIRPKH